MIESPNYRDDILQTIAQMQRQIAQLYSAAQTRPAIARFSQPVVLADSAQPPTPSGGCAIYAVSGQLRVIYSDGTVMSIPDLNDFQVPQAAFVASISGTPGDAPSTYSQAYAQSLRNQMDEIRDYCHATRDTEIAAGLRQSA
ncbi:MAG TPA: hypothetical protein VIS06_02335 [Mycobacteriales bacterium]